MTLNITLPETNIAPENGWLGGSFPFGMAYFQVLCYVVLGRVTPDLNTHFFEVPFCFWSICQYHIFWIVPIHPTDTQLGGLEDFSTKETPAQSLQAYEQGIGPRRFPEV